MDILLIISSLKLALLCVLAHLHGNRHFHQHVFSLRVKKLYACTLLANFNLLCENVQVANQETYGTLGAIVRSQTGARQIGFLTNRHVAVDLDYPNQKMFHPLPPTLGPGVYLGAVERATSFIRDDLWYGIFAGINPGLLLLTTRMQIIIMN